MSVIVPLRVASSVVTVADELFGYVDRDVLDRFVEFAVDGARDDLRACRP